MIRVLVDHNVEGQALMLWGTLSAEGWEAVLSAELVTLAEAGLAPDSSDREVWRFAQRNGMILLTDNRNMSGADSLEQTIQEENTMASLPVLTLGDAKRVVEREYRERCVARLVEIVLDLDNYRGTARLFVP